MSIGYPDYQDYAQWLGPVLDQGTGVAVPAPYLTLGPYTITNYAQVVLAITAGNRALQVTTTQTRAGTPATLVATAQWDMAINQSDVRPLTLVGDTVTARIISIGAGSQIDYAVWGSNSRETVQTPTGDGDTGAGLAAVGTYVWEGLRWFRARSPVIYHTRATAQVVAGTPASLWTPPVGMSFRLMVGELSLSVAGQIILKDGGVEFLRSPQLGAGSTWSLPPIGNGYISANANAVLSVDVSATGNVGGWVGGTEE